MAVDPSTAADAASAVASFFGSDVAATINSGGTCYRYRRHRSSARNREIGSKSDGSHRTQSEAAAKIQTAMILAIAFCEAIAIYALVVALIIKFV